MTPLAVMHLLEVISLRWWDAYRNADASEIYTDPELEFWFQLETALFNEYPVIVYEYRKYKTLLEVA